jgi:hypothetical protein
MTDDRRLPLASGWQPMETAPEGQTVLIGVDVGDGEPLEGLAVRNGDGFSLIANRDCAVSYIRLIGWRPVEGYRP